MQSRSFRILALTALALSFALVGGTARNAAATLPSGNTVQQWDEIAANTVVSSGAFGNEGLQYMAYVSAAIYDAVTSIEGGYQPYGPAVAGAAGASSDAAVVEAACATLTHYFPAPRAAGSPDLENLCPDALGLIADGTAKTHGIAVGDQAAHDVFTLRSGDGLQTPIGSTSALPPLAVGPGVWRLTPPASGPYLAPQTPWVGSMRPYILQSADQFLPDPPPSLSSQEWVDAFNQIKALGSAGSTARTADETATGRFYGYNVILQYNWALRDLATSHALSLLETARLMAMVSIVGADAQIAVMNAKYHYRFWRPVTAIDPTSVEPGGDLFGPAPGVDDGNPATVEQAGWRPLLITPNHPEYPAAHGSFTSAMAEVFTEFLGGPTNFELTLHGSATGGGLNSAAPPRTFTAPNDLRAEIINARLWAGLHYHFSGVAGVVLGRKVAKYDLRHAFQPVGEHNKPVGNASQSAVETIGPAADASQLTGETSQPALETNEPAAEATQAVGKGNRPADKGNDKGHHAADKGK
jgi:hypothetical protein